MFLLVSPYISNLTGQWLDDLYVEEAEKRIQEIRRGPIKIQLETSDGTLMEGKTIKFEHVQHEFLFGAMFFHYNRFSKSDETDANETFARLFKDVFNFALLAFYWVIWEDEDTYGEQDRIDESIEYCLANDITMKGHCLIWNHPAGKPDWLKYDEINAEEKLHAFENHVKDTITQYKGIINYWDVINEISHRPFPEFDTDELCHDLFNWGDNANPDATLIYNDYGLLGHDFGNGPTFKLLSRLNEKGTPFDAIGMQDHAFELDWVPSWETWATLEAYKTLDKEIHITEAWAPSAPLPITNSWKKGLWSEDNQADYLRRHYTMLFSHPSVESINYWGFEDDKDKDDPNNNGLGLVRNDFSKKPSYQMLDHLINEEWHTKGEIATNNDGEIQFTGFYGTYNITIDDMVYQIKAESGEENDFRIIK